MNSPRVAWIDVCRGIGILSVIYAHGLDDQSIRYLFYAFHLPLFFFLSGIVFHHKQHESFLKAIKKAWKGVLLPYFLFAGISYVIWFITTQPSVSLARFGQQLVNILYANGSGKELFYNVSLWFLPCLFATRVLFTTLTFLTLRKIHIVIALVSFGGIGYLLSHLFPTLKLPFGLETALTAIIFFGLGFLWNSYQAKTASVLQKHSVLMFLGGLVITIILAYWNYSLTNTQIDMRLNRLDNHLLFYLASFSGITSCLGLSFILQNNRLLQYLGKQSMILFVWHLIIFTFISKFLLLFLTSETIREFRNLYFAPLYTVISISVILIGAFLVTILKNRFFAVDQAK